MAAEQNIKQVETLELQVKELQERVRETEETTGALLMVQEDNRELNERLTAAEINLVRCGVMKQIDRQTDRQTGRQAGRIFIRIQHIYSLEYMIFQ